MLFRSEICVPRADADVQYDATAFLFLVGPAAILQLIFILEADGN